MKNIKLDDDLHKRLKIAAAEAGEKLGAYVARLLENELKRKGCK
jgi:predicted HicB family RNase H-like nuclease